MGNVLKRYNGTSWETVGGTITGDTLPIGSEVDYVGENVPAGWEEVDSYSTSEINTGQTWTDGKPIYRKVLNYSGVITNGQTIPHGISNFNELAGEGLKAIMYFNSRYYALPLIGRTNDYIVGVAWIDGTNIEMILGSGNGNNFNCSINFVIEYTKTTD